MERSGRLHPDLSRGSSVLAIGDIMPLPNLQSVRLPKHAIVVCGPLHCGSGALGHIFSILGAGCPKTLLQAAMYNSVGGQAETIAGANNQILQRAGSDLHSVVPISHEWFDAPGFGDCVRAAREALLAEYESEFIVLEDPRISLLIPVWHAALLELGYTPHYVISTCPPAEAAKSLFHHHLQVNTFDAWPRPRPELLWLRYLTSALRHTRESSRAVIFLDVFCANWKSDLRRLAEEFEFNWPRLNLKTENEIIAFLNGRRGSTTTMKPQPFKSTPSKLSNDELAGALYELLHRAHSDDVFEADIEALLTEYDARIARTGDILLAMEGAYSLLLNYDKMHQTEKETVASLLRQQQRDHQSMQRFWSQIEKFARQNVSLSRELEDLTLSTDQLEFALLQCDKERKYAMELLQQIRTTLVTAGMDTQSVPESLKQLINDILRVHERNGLLEQEAEKHKKIFEEYSALSTEFTRIDKLSRALFERNEELVGENALLRAQLTS